MLLMRLPKFVLLTLGLTLLTPNSYNPNNMVGGSCTVEEREATCLEQPPKSLRKPNVLFVHWFAPDEFNLPSLLLNFPNMVTIHCHNALQCRNSGGIESVAYVRLHSCRCAQEERKTLRGEENWRTSQDVMNMNRFYEEHKRVFADHIDSRSTLFQHSAENPAPSSDSITLTVPSETPTVGGEESKMYRSYVLRAWLGVFGTTLSLDMFLDIVFGFLLIVICCMLCFIFMYVRAKSELRHLLEYVFAMLIKFPQVRHEITRSGNKLKASRRICQYYSQRKTKKSIPKLLHMRTWESSDYDSDNVDNFSLPPPPSPPVDDDEMITEL